MQEETNLSVLLRRLDMAERNHTDLARTATMVVNEIGEIRKPLDELRLDRAVRAEREKNLNLRLDRIEESIANLYGLGKRLIGSFVGALVVLLVNFLWKGGFYIGQ